MVISQPPPPQVPNAESPQQQQQTQQQEQQEVSRFANHPKKNTSKTITHTRFFSIFSFSFHFHFFIVHCDNNKKQNHNSKTFFFKCLFFSFGNPNTQVTARYMELLGIDLSRWTRFQSGEINSMIVELFRSGNVYLPKLRNLRKKLTNKNLIESTIFESCQSLSLSLTHNIP